MSFLDVDISELNLSLPNLHLSLECGDNVVRQQTLGTDITDMQPEAAEEKALTEYVAADMLFLSKRKLKDVEDSILKNSALKNLYLEGNQISSLPDLLFNSLPNLLWLDLRNNQISSLPAEIGLHRSLRTLLLEGNPITELPPELGNVITLKALNLRNCPIRFPPQDVVRQGLQSILQYLRSSMARRPLSVRNFYPDMPPMEKLQLSELVKSSMELSEDVVDDDELRRFRELKQQMILMDRADVGLADPAIPKLTTLPAIKRKKYVIRAAIVPELPPFDTRCWKRSEERKPGTIKEMRERQAILEQRRKDQEVLQEWCTHAKVMQERKVLEHKQERRERPKREEATCETTAHNPSRGSQRQRPFESQMQHEEARLARDCELEHQVRGHVQVMRESGSEPRGMLQEQTATATATQQDMAELRKLQAELLDRKNGKDIEYRFLAFTGETSSFP